MGQNKIIQNTNIIINVNVVSGYCACCLKKLDSDKDIVRDIDNNEFCCRGCRSDYYRELRDEIEDIMGSLR